jgi:uncharacterized membrane protein HdeD (DUF308 family)
MSSNRPDIADAEAREMVHALGNMWWAWLVMGILWTIASLVILQFNTASITTIGVIVGVMFIVVALQNFAMAALGAGWRWLWIVFGVLFLIAGIYSFVEPAKTFAGFADALGFLFLLVGLWWMLRAFVEREQNSLWWVGLVGSVLMLIMAFWTSGQFFTTKAYTLLVFAGIWALMQGITDIVWAFQIRRLRNV